MKRLLLAAMALLTLAITARAQHWTYTAGSYSAETVVYADLVLNGTTITEQSTYQQYEVAAFIGDEVRALGELMQNSGVMTHVAYLLRFRVEGDLTADADKSITFKAYKDGVEYDLELREEPLPTFTGETLDPGTPSNLRHLYLTEPESLTLANITLNVGESIDLTSYLTVDPKEATLPNNLTWTIVDQGYFTIDGNTLTATAPNTSGATLRVTAGNLTASGKVTVLQPATSLVQTTTELTISVGQQLQSLLDACYTLTPANTTDYIAWTVADNSIVGGESGSALTGLAVGQTTLTGRLYSHDGTVRSDIDPITVTVYVVQELTGISVTWPATLTVGGQCDDLVVAPVPADATINSEDLTLSVTYADNPGWNALELLDGYTDDGSWHYMFNARIPGRVTITVSYVNGETVYSDTSDPIEIGYTYRKQDGWAWHTIPYGYPGTDGLQTVFGDNLVEIRTQEGLLYNDPTYGYFGDTNLLTQNQCFKVKMNQGNDIDEYTFLGGALGEMNTVTLRRGWNWIPNPYFFARTLDHAFGTDIAFVEGDRIVSKASGFAEYSTSSVSGWTGTLQVLEQGEGYLFYNAGADGRELNYASELQMNDDNDYQVAYDDERPIEFVTEPVNSRRKAAGQSRYTYDPSRFRDNMTIVARVDQATAGDLRAIAFVGDECRGEGRTQDGLLFITVHGNAGEQVSFKVYDAQSGQFTDVNQTVAMRTMLGTVKAPLTLTLGATTAIATTRHTGADATTTYDLGGRRTATVQQGVQLQRLADGSVRKVVVK